MSNEFRLLSAVAPWGRWLVLGLVAGVGLMGCDPEPEIDPNKTGGKAPTTGGSSASGGTQSTGGTPTGGVPAGGTSTGGANSGGAGGSGATDRAALSVLVVDPLGYPVPAATVLIRGQPPTSASAGTSVFTDIAAGHVVATISAPGYAEASAVIELPAGVSAYTRKAIVPLGNTTTIDPRTDTGASNGDVLVTLPAASFYDGDTLVTDPVDITITLVDPASEPSSAPGPLEGLDAQGQSVLLDSLFMADISAWHNGQRLEFRPPANGPGATIEMPVASSAAKAGEVIPAWYYEVAAGRWRQEGSGTVVSLGRSLVWRGEVRHLSWWDYARADLERSCVKVTVQSASGPVPGASVEARGIGYAGPSFDAATDPTGTACVDFKLGSEALVSVLPWTTAEFPPLPVKVVGGTVPANCQNYPARCTSATLQMPAATTCVSGTVTGPAGTPITGAAVALDGADNYAARTGVTDGAGHYCFDVPPDFAAVVRGAAENGQGEVLGPVTTPIPFSTGAPGPSCATGGCSDHPLVLGPVSTACYTATLTRNSVHLAAGTPFQVYRNAPQWLIGGFVCPVDQAGTLVAQGTVGASGHVCFNLPVVEANYTLATADCQDPATFPHYFNDGGYWVKAYNWYDFWDLGQVSFGACGAAGRCRPLGTLDLPPEPYG